MEWNRKYVCNKVEVVLYPISSEYFLFSSYENNIINVDQKGYLDALHVPSYMKSENFGNVGNESLRRLERPLFPETKEKEERETRRRDIKG